LRDMCRDRVAVFDVAVVDLNLHTHLLAQACFLLRMVRWDTLA
jgi:hypothetical protein